MPADPDDQVPAPADAPPSRRRAARLAALVVVAVLVVAGGLYVTAYLLASGTTPRHATVAGVDIGGLSRADAAATLKASLAEREQAPIDVQAGAAGTTVDPADAGLSFDYAASVDRSGVGRSWDPRHLWRVLSGGGDHEIVVRADAAKLSSAVAEIADELDRSPKDATIGYSGTQVTTTRARSGITVDRRTAGATITAAYRDKTSATLEAAGTEPAITDDEIEQLASAFARPAVSAPVRVTVKGAGAFDLTPAMIARSVRFSSKDATPTAALDPAELRKQVNVEIRSLHLDQPTDAKIIIKHGKPTVVPSKDGVDVSGADLVAAVEPVLTKTGKDRAATVPSTGAHPTFSTADANKLGVKEVVGEFTTTYPHAAYRNTNLGLAAEKINNTLLKPGDVFSLDKVLGPRDAAHGWAEGYVISNGRLVKEVAGGISQSATTTYNAAFFAGLKDVEHHPHTLYFPRYPAGREATMYGSVLDLEFADDTPYGVLMQAFISPSAPGRQGSLTVRVWSTKYYTVKTAEPTRSDYTTGTTRTVKAANCQYQAPIQGFTARYDRRLYRGDTLVRTEHYRWTYTPGDEIRCA